MKKYKLLKDLPFLKAGAKFRNNGWELVSTEISGMSIPVEIIENFDDWFEEIKSFEIPDEFKEGFWTISYDEDGFCAWHIPSYNPEEYYTKLLKHYMGIGLVFTTRKEAEKHLEWLKARAILLEDTKGSKHGAFKVFYNTVTDFGVSRSVDYITPKNFDTREDAENSIKNHEKEWKIYLGVE